MTLADLRAAWNAQADAMNQWDDLGLDEIVDFAQQMERERCIAWLLALHENRKHLDNYAAVFARQMRKELGGEEMQDDCRD